MITKEERKRLFLKEGLPGIGWDCEGEIIMAGDRVEVVEEDKGREGLPEYSFCSIGKQGKAVRIYGDSWILIVEFPTDQKPLTVGCTDIHLRKV